MQQTIPSASTSPTTLNLLLSKKIKIWQACLRENKTILELQKEYKNQNQIDFDFDFDFEFEFELGKDHSPEYAPVWAGGKGGKTHSKKKIWSWQELETLEEGIANNTLYPWEACFLFGQPSKKIIRIIEKLSIDISKATTPYWIPKWATIGKVEEKPEHSSPFPKNKRLVLKIGEWTTKEQENLRVYWKLEFLGTVEIAEFLERDHEETLAMAIQLNLGTKKIRSEGKWCGINWDFVPNTPTDPKLLNSTTQHRVAEMSATRFSLLYETLENIKESDKQYKKIQKELSKIVELHHRIFSKYLSVKSRKYNYQGISSWTGQLDLEQAGKTAIFECLRRWHPNRGIHFSRGAVCIAINREMIAWVEQQRLVELPDKIRATARQLKQADDKGCLESEYNRLKKEAGEKCVKEASKHKNTYAYLSTIPLMDSHDEDLAEVGGINTTSAECLDGFASFSTPEENTDTSSLLLQSTENLSKEEKKAILAYYGIATDGTHIGPKTLEEIGAEENVTKERIRQRIFKGKGKMRRWLESKNIRNVNEAFHIEG